MRLKSLRAEMKSSGDAGTRTRGDAGTLRSSNRAKIAASPRRRVTVSFLVSLMLASLGGACHRDASQSLTRAVEAWDSGDYKLAAEQYERYLYQNPTGDKAPDARFQLANIYYFKLQRYDRASANYTAFLEQSPSHPNAPLVRERLAEVLGEMGRSYEAIAEYENLNPQDSSERRRIRLRIADLYFAGRNYSQALTEYDKVIENVPYDELSEQAYLREASVYHVERGQYQQALPVYQRLVSMSNDPKLRLRATYGMVECYAGLYQFDEAIRSLRSIKDEPEQTDVSRRIVELEQQKREAAQARTGLQTRSETRNKTERATASENNNEPRRKAKSDIANENKNEPKRKAKTSIVNENKNLPKRKTRSGTASENKNESKRKAKSNIVNENKNLPKRKTRSGTASENKNEPRRRTRSGKAVNAQPKS
jgi:tetratricopeptide (TPR) repeat protein